MNRSFWNLFKPASAKFTLEELRELYGVLVRNPVVTEANRAVVVETIRRVAEYMIWGDQNEPRIFDFFLENNIMTYLNKVLLQPANRTGEVAKQVLQTLSIIIQNVRSETAIFFLFSNNHLNNIVDLDFDFDDEEVLGYYISFLKTISLKLNRGTVQFFINTHRDAKGFPLYTRAIKLAHNREGMVRAAVRTLTLHVYSVVDPDIEAFVTSPPANQYFADVAMYLAYQIQLLDRRMLAAEGGGSQALASLDSQLAEVEDVVSYVSDLLSLGVPSIAQLLASGLWQHVTQPLLLTPLMQPDAAATAAAQQQSLQPQVRPGVTGSNRSGSSLLGSPAGLLSASPNFKGSGWSNGPLAAGQDGRPSTSKIRPVCAVFVLERLFHLVMYPPLLQQLLLALACGGSSSSSSDSALPVGTTSSSSSSACSSSVSCRRTLLGILTSGQSYPAVMVLRLFVSVLHNRHISRELLAALSVLPRRVQQQGPSGMAHSGSDSSKDPGQLAVMVQAVLSQLQALTVAEQQQQQQPLGNSSSSTAGGMHRRSSSMNLLNLLTQQYLPDQLHALVQGQEQDREQTDHVAAVGSSDASGVIQSLESWLAKAEEVAAAAASDEAVAASSAFSALGPQLLAALLQLLQLQGLPAHGLRLLGWLLHQLLPVAPQSDSPPAAAAEAGLGAAVQRHPAGHSVSQLAVTPEGSEAAGALISRHNSSSSDSSSSSVNSQNSGDSSAVEGSESIDADGSMSRTSSLLSAAGASTECESLADSHSMPPPVSITHVPSFRSVSGHELRASVLSYQQQQQLQAAVDAAQAEFRQQLCGMWCEAVFPMLAQEWAVSREMLQRPVLRAGSDALLSGTAVWPLLQGLQAAAAPGTGGGGAAFDALSVSGQAALACYLAVQRVVALVQLQELLACGMISRLPPVPTVTEADLKQVDIQEGYQVDLAPGSAVPCVVSFAPGQERRVYFAVAGLSRKQLAAVLAGSSSSSLQESSSATASLLRSLPLAVLADPSLSRPQAGIVLSVAPLLGAHPYADQNVPKWLHVHVRPSVRGLLRVIKIATAKKGGLLSAMRQLADGHWVLAFSGADRAAAAVRLVELHVTHLQRLYGDALAPLAGQQQQQQQQSHQQQDVQEEERPPPQQQQQQQLLPEEVEYTSLHEQQQQQQQPPADQAAEPQQQELRYLQHDLQQPPQQLQQQPVQLAAAEHVTATAEAASDVAGDESSPAAAGGGGAGDIVDPQQLAAAPQEAEPAGSLALGVVNEPGQAQQHVHDKQQTAELSGHQYASTAVQGATGDAGPAYVAGEGQSATPGIAVQATGVLQNMAGAHIA